MVCIFCEGDTRVINSRLQKRANGVWRRRQCTNCRVVFTTIEEADLTKSIVVRKRKYVEPFSRDKLLFSIYDSLRHRKTAINDASGLTDTIIARLYPVMLNALIDKSEIAAVSFKVLRRFDKVAATHYQAFHISKY